MFRIFYYPDELTVSKRVRIFPQHEFSLPGVRKTSKNWIADTQTRQEALKVKSMISSVANLERDHIRAII